MVLKQRIYFAQWKFELPGFTILGKDVSRQRKYIGVYLMFLCVCRKNVVGFRLKYQLIGCIGNLGYTTLCKFRQSHSEFRKVVDHTYK